MALIAFVQNYDDLSTDRGYQFKFFCDHCGNGVMSTFNPSAVGIAGSLFRAAGDLFGGVLSSAGQSAYDVQQAVGGKAHDDALRAAVEEARGHFQQCTRCGQWVCAEACWNAAAGLCEACAPDFEESLAAAQAQAKVEAMQSQLQEKAASMDYASGVDLSAGGQRKAKAVAKAAAVDPCASCGSEMDGAKFCPECGHPRAQTSCPKCKEPLKAGAKFCGECGAKL